MGKLVQAFYRLFLDTVDPTYAVTEGERLYFDIRLGLTNAGKMALGDLTAIQQKDNVRRAEAIKAQKPMPALSADWYDADNRGYPLYIVGTNVKQDADGADLPPYTTPEFWAAMPQDIKDAIIATFNHQSETRYDRLSGKDFTKAPASS